MRELRLSEKQAPPHELRIWTFGKIRTAKGTFLFDKKSARDVMAAYAEHGNDLMFDFEHKAVDPDARVGEGKAAGWFKLELRDDGLYAIDIKWTDKAARELAAREWRYWSPAFLANEKTSRIERLTNIALTNIPATFRLQPLVAASQKGTVMEEEMEDTVEAEAPQLAEDCKPNKSLKDRIASIKTKLKALEDELEDSETMEDDPDSEPEETGLEDDEPDHDEPDGDELPPAKMSLVAAAQKATGVKTKSAKKLAGALIALSEQTARYASLERRVARFEANEKKGRIDLAIREGKLEPHRRAWALKLDAKVLDGYLSTAQPKTKTVQPAVEASAETPNGKHVTVEGKSVFLSQAEIKMAKTAGVSLDAFAKRKADGLKSLDFRGEDE